MRKTAATILLAALPFAAAGQDLPDANGDGAWSMEELQVSVPGLTAEVFASIDTDADGSIDPDELAAAIAAGVITPDI